MTPKPINSQIEELKRVLLNRLHNYTNSKNTLHRFEKDLDLLFKKGKQEAQSQFLEMIDKLSSDTYYSCDCGDYDEGCIKCFRNKLKSQLTGDEK